MQQDKMEQLPPLSILLIEDEDLLREYLSDFLEDLGYTTLQADNGRKGIETIRNHLPDLVITDLRMPEMNGLEVLSFMQAEYPEIPVIILSGTGTLADVIQSMKLGAWDYILKPLHDYHILELSVNRVFERKKLLDENKRYSVHLEEEVIKRTEELSKSTYRFKTLFNLVGDAIFIYNLDGTIADFNQQAVTISGYSHDQLLSMTIQELISSSELNQFMKYSKQITANTQMMFETVLQLKSNLSIPIEVNACIITVEEKPQILAVCRNISERKKAEEERKRFEKQLITAQKMESLGLLASGIAHDFNNILAALNGYAMLLNSEKAAGNEEIEYLQKINEIVQMGQNLTKRITNFIRKEKEELVIVDIHKVLSDTETLLRTSCREVKLCLDLNAEDAEVLGDETQLQNTFLNLGINALDAMPDGGTLLFTTSNKSSPDRQKDEKEICITVGDTGIGMEPETLYRIFDPLYTTKERDKGTGLGLTSVLYCINNLHGKIDVESVPGRGTTFSIYLPLVRERVLT